MYHDSRVLNGHGIGKTDRARGASECCVPTRWSSGWGTGRRGGIRRGGCNATQQKETSYDGGKNGGNSANHGSNDGGI